MNECMRPYIEQEPHEEVSRDLEERAKEDEV
jgi:hypothetical protein